MKTSVVLAVVAAAGSAVAQSQNLPTCATNCASEYLQQGIGNCGTDPACICADGNFLGGIACCLVGACSPSDQTSAVAYAQSLCAANGVTVPGAVTCSTVAPSLLSGVSSASASTTSPSASGPSQASHSDVSSTPTASPSAAAAFSTTSQNYGPRPTAAAALGAIGGLVAAVAIL